MPRSQCEYIQMINETFHGGRLHHKIIHDHEEGMQLLSSTLLHKINVNNIK